MYATSDKPGGQAVVELLFPVSKCFFCHDLEVEDEHDHQAILVLHWHHVHHTQKALTCVGRGMDKTQSDWVCLVKTFMLGLNTAKCTGKQSKNLIPNCQVTGGESITHTSKH